MNLATQLRVTADAHVREMILIGKQQQDRKFKEAIRSAQEIGRQIITNLPEFLERMAKNGRNRAFIVTFDTAPLYKFHWPTPHWKQQFETEDNLSSYWIKKYLFGAPKQVALWGKGQTLKVSIGRARDYCSDEWSPNEPYYWRRPEYSKPDGDGIVFSW